MGAGPAAHPAAAGRECSAARTLAACAGGLADDPGERRERASRDVGDRRRRGAAVRLPFGASPRHRHRQRARAAAAQVRRGRAALARPGCGRRCHLVADDEAPARRVLSRLLCEHEDVRVAAECADGLAAVEGISKEHPQLVFLDVKMPELDGFEVIEQVGVDAMPPVVFVTAYDEYAIRAFDVRALDYLVKPFSDARFEFTLARARRRLVEMDAPKVAAELRALLDARAPAAPGSLERFLVKLGNRTSVIAA
ncbi:MAG: response regulator, partial [Deltaproteobacteria bacterium]